MLSNDSTFRTFSFERQYTDVANNFAYIFGMAPNTMSITLSPGVQVEGSFGWIGSAERKTETASIASDVSDGVYFSNNVMNGVDGSKGLFEGPDGSVQDFCATEITLDINNNISPVQKLGFLGAFKLTTGQFSLSGNITGIYGAQVSSAYDRFLDFEDTAIYIPIFDDNGNAYLFEVLRAKLGDGARGAPGVNQELFGSFSFTGFKTDAENPGKTLRIWQAPTPVGDANAADYYTPGLIL